METNIKQEIIKMLDAFMANSYLVPSTHTDYLFFTDRDEQYRTYANDSRDYFSYEILKSNERIFSGSASKHSQSWHIAGDNLLTCESSKKQLDTHYQYIKAIYEEIHSLNVDSTKIKEARKQIAECELRIEKENKQIKRLKQQIKDSKKLTN